ncbi:12158_t:CDS:2, partial [Gigaspora margarita]
DYRSKRRQLQATKRAREDYRQHEREQQRKRRKKQHAEKQNIRIEKDIHENNVNSELDDNLSDIENDNTYDDSELSEYIEMCNPISGTSELRSSGVTNNIPTSEKEHVLNLLEKMIQESTENKQDCDDIEMLINQDNFDDNDITPINPYEIMRSGLQNINFVNDALRLKSKL